MSVASVSSDYYNSNNDRHTVAKGWKNCLTLYRSVIIVNPQVVIRTVTTLPEITAVPVKEDFNYSRTGSLVQVRNMRSTD